MPRSSLSVTTSSAPLNTKKIDAVTGLEARGFLFGPVIAQALGVGFVALRKPGKLPGNVVSQEYQKEYGPDKIFVQKDAVKAGARVLIVDDLLATGGTLVAACQLIRKIGAEPTACALVIELAFLKGRELVAKECDDIY